MPLSHRAVQELRDSGEIFYQKMRVRPCAYLNNVIEQDHEASKESNATDARLAVLRDARVVISGIEFAPKIKK